MSGRKQKIVIIMGGVLLLAITIAVLLLLFKVKRNSEMQSAELEKNLQNRVSAETEEERHKETTESKRPNDRGETKESEPTEGSETSEASEPSEGSEASEASEPSEGSETSEASKSSKGSETSGASKPTETETPGKTAGSKEDSLYYGALQVIGASLCDSAGNPVQLRGVSTHGLAWFPDYVNEALFQELHEQWNVNVVRLAMYTAEYGGYCTGGDKGQLKQLVKDGVEYASNQNMYVIIDWHILSDGDPNTYKEEAKSFFGEMSAEFADRENVLYEICNEPNGGTSWNRVKEYANEIIPVIRENDEDAVILVGTPNWSQYVDQAAADPITGWDNIMYTLHFYAATHKDSLRQTMAAAVDGGLPVFVSEYSICDASGNGGIDEAQAEAWVEIMNKYGISYVAWSLSNKNETSALISSSCNRTSGLSEEDLSSTGKWLYGVLTGGQDTMLPGTWSDMIPGGSSGRLPTGSDQGQQSQENQGQDNSGQGQQSQENQGQTGAAAAAAEDLNVTLQLANSWESNGKYFYQYEMTVENVSGRTIDGWKADVVFNEPFELSDSWNGVYSVEGNILHVSFVDYNGQLESGASAENIGFIVSGSAGLLP